VPNQKYGFGRNAAFCICHPNKLRDAVTGKKLIDSDPGAGFFSSGSTYGIYIPASQRNLYTTGLNHSSPGLNNFLIVSKIYTTTLGSYNYIGNYNGSGAYDLMLYAYHSTYGSYGIFCNGNAYSSNYTITNYTNQKLAVARIGGKLYFAANGNLVATITCTDNITTSREELGISTFQQGNGYGLVHGSIFEFFLVGQPTNISVGDVVELSSNPYLSLSLA
jgi:hypothetical protein